MRILLIVLILPSFVFAKEIEYLNYKFDIPDNYNLYNNGKPLIKGSNAIIIVNDNKKGVATVKLVDKSKNFFDLEDYGAASHRDLFHILYSNVPSENEAVLEYKAFNAKYDSLKYEIITKGKFDFFKLTNPMNVIGEVKYFISTPINDEVINIDFSQDKIIEKSIIDSIQVK